MKHIEPFKLSPVFLEKIWGGQALAAKLNKHFDKNSKIGESWEVSGEKPYQSIIASGDYKGMPLGDFCEVYGDRFLGIAESKEFPLLYKFIDANDKLSVQVHPDDSQTVNNNWGTRGKTECWYVVDAKPGASIITGLKQNITRELMRDTIANGTFKELLQEESVHPGDLFFIPAGTIHAIMSGTLIYEVQESSDITYRVYDWDRLDDSGKPRDLHIDKAVQVTDLHAHGSCKIKPVIIEHDGYTHSMRVACRYFALEEYNLTKSVTVSLPVKSSFSVITVVKGAIIVKCSDNSLIDIMHGESVCIPAKVACTIQSIDKTDLILSSVPDIQKEIIQPLRKHIITDKEIVSLGGVVKERNDLLALLDG